MVEREHLPLLLNWGFEMNVMQVNEKVFACLLFLLQVDFFCTCYNRAESVYKINWKHEIGRQTKRDGAKNSF